MKIKYFIGLTVVPTVVLMSTIASAEDIEVRTRNMDIYRRNGSIYIDTGSVRVNSSPSRFPDRRRPYLRPNQLKCDPPWDRSRRARQHTIRQSSRQHYSKVRSSQQTSTSEICY
ncbi:hypothetical protein [Chroococcus sp. FPU101]|uniref:hypothetical protein n=1 Tax=Chroococcus sp. FPU101 TaxID=1974212 RepID=UPI001A8CC1CF|nr:hypothetical protein [Chroococcus sp. FPU101]